MAVMLIESVTQRKTYGLVCECISRKDFLRDEDSPPQASSGGSPDAEVAEKAVVFAQLCLLLMNLSVLSLLHLSLPLEPNFFSLLT